MNVSLAAPSFQSSPLACERRSSRYAVGVRAGPLCRPALAALPHRQASPAFTTPQRKQRVTSSRQRRLEHGTIVANAMSSAMPMPNENNWESLCTPKGLTALVARVRSISFFVWCLLLSLPLFCVMLAVYPFVLLLDKHRRQAEHFVNMVWAKLSMRLFTPVQVEGLENLPAVEQPAVYVANHLSYMDIFTLFQLNRPFKFISKTSNFLIPIVGWSMFLTGHIQINRTDKKSQLACLKQCGVVLKNGASVLFFPEGTRSKDGCMHAFKKGAFSVAAKAKVPVVPVTLVNTGDLMPNGHEYLLHTGNIKMVVHKPIPPSDANTMMEAARERIAAALPRSRVADE